MAFLNEDLLPQDSYSDPYPPDGGGMDSTTSQPDNTGTGDDGSGSNKGSWRDYQVTPPNTVNPPPAPPPSTGFYNPVIDTSGVLNTIPAFNSVFKNPLNTGGFSAPSPMSLNMGGGIQLPSLANNFSNPVTDRTPALVNPALQGNFKNAFERSGPVGSRRNDGNQQPAFYDPNLIDQSVCFDIVFEVDSACTGGPAFWGAFNFVDKAGRNVAGCNAYSGCNLPSTIFWGISPKRTFTVEEFTDYGMGVLINFKVTLSPSDIPNPKTGGKIECYLFPLPKNREWNKGTIDSKFQA